MKHEPISVLMFSNEPVRGGVEEHILQLLCGLDRAYFRLHLACTPQLAELLRSDLPSDVEVVPVTLDHVGDVAGAYTLARFILQQKIQILHSHMFRASLFASPIGWMHRVPVIIETDHVREVWRTGWKACYFVDRFAARFVDRIIAVSSAIAKYLIEEKGIPAAKITVIRTAAALRRFSPDPCRTQSLKRSLDFAEDDPLLALVGRLEPQKGHKVLIEALPSVLREFPRVCVVFLGEGSLRAELETLVAERGLSHQVRFAGYQTNIEDWLAVTDLSVLPSFYEGLPMSAIESLAMGCPMVATAVDGTPEVVMDGKTGLLVPPGDPARLAEAICEMLRHPQRAREMGRAGREFVFEQLSVERLVQSTQTLYLDAWEKHLGGSSASARQKKLLVPGRGDIDSSAEIIEDQVIR
jgi:glycosyltransferase involved in cell wall biosynthesis